MKIFMLISSLINLSLEARENENRFHPTKPMLKLQPTDKPTYKLTDKPTYASVVKGEHPKERIIKRKEVIKQETTKVIDPFEGPYTDSDFNDDGIIVNEPLTLSKPRYRSVKNPNMTLGSSVNN